MSLEKYSLPSDTYIYSSVRSSRTTYLTVMGEKIEVIVYPWIQLRDGGEARKLYAWVMITTKTRRFVQGMYSVAVVSQGELVMNANSNNPDGILKQMKKEKTKHALMSMALLIEGAYGPGKSFPGLRGRYTVIRIEDQTTAMKEC